jgi:quinohemoprotein ethanol dehydrogenase
MQTRTKFKFTLLAFLAATVFSVQIAIAQNVDIEALENAADSGEEWLSYGRDQGETRYSPLEQVNDSNVAELGVAWTFDTDSYRGLEATPLVSDGVMYGTRAWSSVFALDARTGEQLWNFDPQVDRSIGWKACCDVVNRGVAIYEGKIFVGTIDGRLIALDAKSGSLLWQVQTTDQTRPYTVTSAPRVFDGKVIIGNSGAELGVRGYITAYNASSGTEEWRFWVVPGNPADGFENPDMELAAETWEGDWWTIGGGGTSWDSLAYDPEARLVYVGTGNGSPWSHDLRSNGTGDNLFLSSIVALNVDTGRVAWHYQTTPADNWDYTAVQQLLLTELVIDGLPRKVIMQAPKNGFFYVLDRITGELLSADAYTQVTWASGVDLESGRPIETAQARYSETISMITPGPGGGHNWHSMSFNPDTGLLYLPTEQGSSFPYGIDAEFIYEPGTWNIGVSALGSVDDIPFLEEDEYTEGTGPDVPSPGVLVAWDPIARRARWQINYGIASNGGTLTTAGNLVFQGIGDGHLMAYAADTGVKLWEVDLGVGIMAAPMTFMLDGKQYVSVLVGWGGTNGLIGPNLTGEYKAPGTLWTFELGGDQNIVPIQGISLPELTAIDYDDSPEVLAMGADQYQARCFVCHGTDVASGGVIADLRYASAATYNIFNNIVREGAYTGLGMPNLGEFVSEEEADAIKNFILSKRAALMSE